MPRMRRIIIKNTLYHVFNRGVEKKNIFKCDADRIKFLTILEKALKKFNFIIYAYVLMPNHYHILLEDIDGKISEIMKYINENYAMYYNWKYKRVGHLFQNRYRSNIVEKKFYLKYVARYIILNPIRKGLVKNLKYYNWSSYYEYLNKNKRFKLTDTSWINNEFGYDKEKSLRLFRRFLTEQDDVTEKIINESLMLDMVLGTKEFKEKLIEKIKIYKNKIKINIFKSNNEKEIKEILDRVKKIFKINDVELQKKKGKNNFARKISMYLLKQKTNKTLDEIGKIFSLHPINVCKNIKSIEKEIQSNYYLQKILQSF
ncbi:MAG: transposase [Candidatus Goldbacteria bacterium]|nr:transposase [Candidatus Goldiibacteriota bacterium]